MRKPHPQLWSFNCIAICTVLGLALDPKSIGKRFVVLRETGPQALAGALRKVA